MRKYFNFIPAGLLLWAMASGCAENDVMPEVPEHILEMDNVTIHSADDIQEADSLKLIFKQSYGDSDDVMLGSLSFIDVDHSGRVYIADQQENDIKVFNNEGEFVRTIGRSGDGPGEFRQISSMQIENNTLWIHDNNLKRISAYDIETGLFNNGVPVAANQSDIEGLESAYLRGIHWLPENRFLIDFSKTKVSENITGWETVENRSSFYLMDDSGEIVSGPLFEKTSSYHVMIMFGERITGAPVDFYPNLQVETTANGNIYTMWPEHYLLKTFDRTGERLRADYFPVEQVVYDPAKSFDGVRNEMTERARNEIDFPEFEPVSDRLLTDEQNRIWTSVNTREPNKDEWWVLDGGGELLARFSWSSDESLETVKGDYVYTKQTDPDSGLQNVARYKVER